MLTTVEENCFPYTNCQLEKAKKARDLLRTAGLPTVRDLKKIVNSNSIQNNPVTTEDINIAEKIFGPDIASLKGKTTRSNPAPFKRDIVEVPREIMKAHKHVALCIDGMYVNGIPFLTTISRKIMYRTCYHIANKSMSEYRRVLDIVFRLYNYAGFRVTSIACDNEFKPLMDPLKDDLNIRMDYCAPQAHVPEEERNNRVIKEQLHGMFHALPFQNYPTTLVIWGATEAADKLNMFCPKGGISPYYSPHTIMKQPKLDYNTDFKCPFGDFVQAHHETDPTNTMEPRTLDCIYLRYNRHQRTHELLDLQTARVIGRDSFT